MLTELTPDQWLQFGAVIVFAWFSIQIFEKVFGLIALFINKDKAKDSEGQIVACLGKVDVRLGNLESLIVDLHEWHNVKDPRTGTLVWYSSFQNSALQETLTRVSETLQSITDVLKEMSVQQRESQKDQQRAMAALADQGKETKAALGKIQADIGEVRHRVDRSQG